MKTNEIFSWARFGRYAKSMWMLNKKQLLILAGTVAFCIYIAVLYFRINERQWNNEDWLKLFFQLAIVIGFIYTGFSFTGLRSRNKTMFFLMIPASATEKCIYEFIFRVVSFLLLYSLFFYFFANLALGTIEIIEHLKLLRVKITYSYAPKDLMRKELIDNLILWSGALILALSLSFAGAVTFQKNQVTKTILFLGLTIIVIYGYFYLIFDVWKYKYPWFTLFEKPDDKIMKFLFFLISNISSIIILVFAFFKLKEKEA